MERVEESGRRNGSGLATRLVGHGSPEWQRLISDLIDALPDNYRLPVLTAAYTGLRAGELWALRREDVNLHRGELIVDEAVKEISTVAPSLTENELGLIFGPTRPTPPAR